MATVRELSDPYTHLMLNPVQPESEDTCSICTTFTQGYANCYSCAHNENYADAVLPISYSVHFGQLHTNLAGYKRGGERTAARLGNQLAAVLWRFLEKHEECLAQTAGADAFELVTTVPSGSSERDVTHPLRRIVGELVGPTRERYERLLVRSDMEVAPRVVDVRKYNVLRNLDGEDALLVDDTWTTGASVQSAAGALKMAGAGVIGAVVFGRHVHEDFGDNADRLEQLPGTFDWNTCALCADE